ncbi:WavE lipopolysaccharide synthesis family protein [Legionella fairfieldensis]|uniref:WavE lipopolysaccharide synthesis family protein n=1 Tax=Legionella fairfieldensis TaxID=45064 RepID=UPI00048F45FD|nr:WavE lipopolysaccharide synthesis family protein [Legionella fairfieldensis]
MIPDKDISIVVQGPILTQSKYDVTEEITQLACLRLKKLFPTSELILSTWEGEDTRGIVYDKVIMNKDPGASWFDYYNHKLLNNCNRLIISTLAGIKAASRKYVFKVRSDLFLVSKKFLNYFEHYPLYNTECKFVKARILAFSMWSIQGHKTSLFTMHKPFHISDWAYFGYKEDLMDLYDVPLIPEPHFSQWFLTHCKPFFDIAPSVLWKMPPEQHITSSFLNKHTPIKLEHTADTSNNNCQISAKMLMNNFLVLDQTQFFLISLKHFCFQFSRENHEWFIYHHTWLKNYYGLIKGRSFFNRLKYQTLSYLRQLYLFSLYNILRVINVRTKWIDKLSAYCIKKWTKNS